MSKRVSSLKFCRSLVIAALLSLLGGRVVAADPSPAKEAYDKLVSQYMAGQWDDLETSIKANPHLYVKLTTPQKADWDYINQTLTECHPAWWNQAKSGKLTQIKMSVFGTSLTALYDPTQKQSMNASFNGDVKTFKLGWVAAEMDNPDQAEHGFTKGELAGDGVWSTLGEAAAYSQLSQQALMSVSSEDDKTKLFRVLDFRGAVTAAYYGTPRMRQWWYFLALHYYRPEYEKQPNVMSRKALGAMFVAELAAHPRLYPSIKLPVVPYDEGAEEQMVTSVHDRIEKHGWTLAEDKLIRDATKAFALANSAVIRTGGPVQLANGLQVSLDPAADAALRVKRDQWLVKVAGKTK
jgi:hypothetical protein